MQQLSSSTVAQSQASPNGYFDKLWSNIRDSVCGDVTADISNQITPSGFSDNPFRGAHAQAYNINCQTEPQGLLVAHILHSWEDQFGFTITGTRLHLDYDVPLNAVSFSVAAASTCNDSSLTCPQDPVFTVVFDVHLVINADSVNESTLFLPPATSQAGSIVLSAIDGGDHTQEIVSAYKDMINSIGKDVIVAVATGGTLGAADLAQDVGQFLAQVADIEITAVLNAHLRDLISANLNINISNALGTAVQHSGQDFGALFNDLAAHGSDFSTLTVSAGNDDSLIFRLTDPAPGKPGVHNKPADLNSQPSIIAPSIGVAQPQVKQGDKIQVLGQFFPFTYVTRLVIDWDRNVFGNQTQSELRWGPQGGAVTDLTTSDFSFEADNLTPNTIYVFQVRECDLITCSPFSDPLLATTQAKGSDSVAFRLDSPSVLVLGTATIGNDGSFAGFATIPLTTTTGSHSLEATVGNAAAVTTISVCSVSGCQPALGLVNPDNGTLEAPGSVVQISTPVRLRGNNFTAGQTVSVTIDTLQGTQLGTTTVGSDGTFDATFTMPSTTVGSHTLIAAQTGGASSPSPLPGPVVLPHSLTAALDARGTVSLPTGGTTITNLPPPGEFATIVQATVNIFVTQQIR